MAFTDRTAALTTATDVAIGDNVSLVVADSAWFSANSYSPMIYEGADGSKNSHISYPNSPGASVAGYESYILSAGGFSDYVLGSASSLGNAIGYYGGALISYIVTNVFDPSTLTNWNVVTGTQPTSGGVVSPAPALTEHTVAASDASVGIINVTGFCGPSITGTDHCTTLAGNGSTDVYLWDIGPSDVTIYNAFETEAGEDVTDVSNTTYTRINKSGSQYSILYYDSAGGKLVIVLLTPQTYGGGFSYTKYNVTFDDAAINTAISGAQEFWPGPIASDGFYLVYGSPDLPKYYGGIKLSLDGTSYARYDFSGGVLDTYSLEDFMFDSDGVFYALGYAGGSSFLLSERTEQDYTVAGYSWTQGSAKQILEPMLSLYDVDARPHDFGIEFLPRGGASVGTINTEDFVRQNANDVRYKIKISNDTDLPRRLFLTFKDSAHNQEPNSVLCQRPADTVDSARELSVDMTTWVSDTDTAKQMVDRMFRRPWFARESGELSLTPMERALEPGDVQSIEFDGETLTMRLIKIVAKADGVIETTWERDDPALAVLSGASGATAFGIPDDVLLDPAETKGFVLDIPLLADSHDQTTPFVYVAAGTVDESKVWIGADFLYSDTGASDTYESGWDAVGSTDSVTYGVTSEVFAAASTAVIDNGTQLTVEITSGTLTSITQTAMLADNTANLALIGDEMVQFMNATLESAIDGVRIYTLSGFVRGARGTEWAIDGHASGEDFVLLNALVHKHSLGASEIGDTDYYIPITQGFNQDSGTVIALDFTAVANKPYAPSHVEAVRNTGSGDWTINWIRRTRIGGATLNGQDVPLGETSESYKVQILDGATVVRTITATTNSAAYTSAEQTTDFGSPQTSLAGKVAQVSPTLSLDGYFTEFAA